MVADNDVEKFCVNATTHIGACVRSSILDDEIADSDCMLPSFEPKVLSDLTQFDFGSLPPCMMVGLSLVVRQCFNETLWFCKERDVPEAPFHQPPSFPLMRRAISEAEHDRIKQAISTGERVEETIFEVGSRTRDWTLVFESPKNKPQLYDKARGFPAGSDAIQQHVSDIEARGAIARVFPTGTNMLCD